jgi:hypothetical protein
MPFRKDSVRTPRLKASKFFTVRSGLTKRKRRTKRSSRKEGVELKGISTANISIHQRDTRLKSNQFQKPRKKPGEKSGVCEQFVTWRLKNNYSHRIHGAAIYGNMDPINIPPMLAYIPYMDPMGFKHKIL